MSFDFGQGKQMVSSQQFTTGTMKLALEERKISSEEKTGEQPMSFDKHDIIEFRDEESSRIASMFSLDYLYTKKQFRRIVKWCTEDPSNIWYDHMETALQDFAEAKQLYKSDLQRPDIENAETDR